MPIVESNGSIIGNISVRDLRGVITRPKLFEALHKSITEFVAANVPDKGKAQPCGAGVGERGLPCRRLVNRIAPLLQHAAPNASRPSARPHTPPSPSPLSLSLEREEMYPSITCKASSTLAEVLTRLASSRIHRIYVVDANNKPIRALTLSDVLAAMVVPNAD